MDTFEVKWNTLMKKFYSLFIILLVLVYSCKKDTTGPDIIIEGDNPYTLKIGETYNDPGARAIDPETGDASGNIEYTGYVDANKVGSYQVAYSASDKFRNKSKVNPVRKVNVVLTSDFLVGYYQFNMADTGNTTIVNYDFATYVNENEIKFYNFTNLDSVYVNAKLSGDFKTVIQVPAQTITHNGKSFTVSGDGTISNDGKTITIDYIQTYNHPVVPTSKAGRVVYTRVYL